MRHRLVAAAAPAPSAAAGCGRDSSGDDETAGTADRARRDGGRL